MPLKPVTNILYLNKSSGIVAVKPLQPLNVFSKSTTLEQFLNKFSDIAPVKPEQLLNTPPILVTTVLFLNKFSGISPIILVFEKTNEKFVL